MKDTIDMAREAGAGIGSSGRWLMTLHGLTLVKTGTGYAVLKLGTVQAQTTSLAQPAHRKPLTEDQKLMCWSRATHDADVEHKTEHQCLMDYGSEIEAAHSIKENT